MKEKKRFYLQHNIERKIHYTYYLVFIIFFKYNDRQPEFRRKNFSFHGLITYFKLVEFMEEGEDVSYLIILIFLIILFYFAIFYQIAVSNVSSTPIEYLLLYYE